MRGGCRCAEAATSSQRFLPRPPGTAAEHARSPQLVPSIRQDRTRKPLCRGYGYLDLGAKRCLLKTARPIGVLSLLSISRCTRDVHMANMATVSTANPISRLIL